MHLLAYYILSFKINPVIFPNAIKCIYQKSKKSGIFKCEYILKKILSRNNIVLTDTNDVGLLAISRIWNLHWRVLDESQSWIERDVDPYKINMSHPSKTVNKLIN